MKTAHSLVSLHWFRLHAQTFCLPLLVATTVQACTHWVPEVGPPSAAMRAGEETWVRATLKDGRKLELRSPRIRNDSLIGPIEPVALSDVRSFEVQRVSAGRTTALLVGLGVTLAVLINSLSHSDPPAPPPRSLGTGAFSCPVVYSWNGHEWIMDSGTFGGAIARGLQRTDVDNLDFGVVENGVLRLKVANILDETEYVDAMRVLAVDHDPGVTVAPDGTGKLHTIGTLVAPIAATDFAGRDARARVLTADGWSWESALTERDTANVEDVRDGIALTFLRPHGAARAHVVIDGNNTPWAAHLMGEMVRAHGSATQAWYDSLNARPEAARHLMQGIASEAFLSVSVRTAGTWTRQGIVWEAGPEVVKRQVADLDLAHVVGDTVRVRLESVPSFWLLDRVALDFTDDGAVAVNEIAPTLARTPAGLDVRDPVTAVDDRYLVLRHGESAELRYDVPLLPSGRSRSFMLASTGWYHVDAPQTGVADVALLRRITAEPNGLSRIAVAKMNAALRTMTVGAAR